MLPTFVFFWQRYARVKMKKQSKTRGEGSEKEKESPCEGVSGSANIPSSLRHSVHIESYDLENKH